MHQFLFTILFFTAVFNFNESRPYKKTLSLMGSFFEITAVAESKTRATEAILAAEAEIIRIEKLISSWDQNSQTSAINQNAGIQAIKVEKELFDLIKKSLEISEMTDGAFDISFASIDRIWKFDGSMIALPDSHAIAKSVQKINYRNIILNEIDCTVFLKEKGMKIGFGAIGKGYAANRAKAVMYKRGIKNGIVNAGGDLLAWGQRNETRNWKIGIADPEKRDSILTFLELENTAIVTSGDAEKYAIIAGKRYAHIIDPRNGYPASGLKSVSILHKDAALADALATAVFVLGQEAGIQLINQLEEVDYFIINEANDVFTSIEALDFLPK